MLRVSLLCQSVLTHNVLIYMRDVLWPDDVNVIDAAPSPTIYVLLIH